MDVVHGPVGEDTAPGRASSLRRVTAVEDAELVLVVAHPELHAGGRAWATVLIDTRFLPVLHDQFGRHCEADGEHEDGRARVRLAAPTALDIARNLAGWGSAVEVVAPTSVRIELARIGAELTGRYSDVGAPAAG